MYRYATRIVVAFWLSVLAGFGLPALVDIGVDVLRDHESLAKAVDTWISRLFLPGYNRFLLAVIHAVPFVLLAVAARFVLTSGSKLGRQSFQRRLTAVVTSLAVSIAFSLWVLISIRTSRSSTAAIGYLFLPIELMVWMPFAYLAGWVVGRRLFGER